MEDAQKDLTTRQKQVLKRLEKGEAPKTIAKALSVTTNAVYQYRRRFVERGLLPDANGDTAPAVVATTNGNGRPAILDETVKALENEKTRIGAALTENRTQQERVAKEIEALSGKATDLKAEDEALSRTEEALTEAEKQVTFTG